MSRTVYVNGSYLPEEEATISIFDRGFIFGDGVYEVIPVIGGKLVDKAPFIERIKRSLGELSIEWPCSVEDYLTMHEELIARNNLEEGAVYSQFTRGAAERDFAFPKDTTATLVAFTQVKYLLNSSNAETGVKVVTVEDIRWKRRDIKSTALLGQVLAKQQAAEKGAFEGWMIEDGHVTEGTSSSAYIVKDGVVITRPLSNEILPGIRRRVLLQLTALHQIKVEERRFTADEAKSADEAFMTSASTFVTPIVEIDGVKVSDGKPGPITRKLREIYLNEVKKEAGLI